MTELATQFCPEQTAFKVYFYNWGDGAGYCPLQGWAVVSADLNMPFKDFVWPESPTELISNECNDSDDEGYFNTWELTVLEVGATIPSALKTYKKKPKGKIKGEFSAGAFWHIGDARCHSLTSIVDYDDEGCPTSQLRSCVDPPLGSLNSTLGEALRSSNLAVVRYYEEFYG